MGILGQSTRILELALASGGIAAALAVLNTRVAHRFTAIYRCQPGFMRLSNFHDSGGGKAPEVLEDVPMTIAYCTQAIMNGQFLIEDSLEDQRLISNPLRAVIRSYAGLPLMSPGGALFGTLCHFDAVPRALSDDEFEFMCMAAVCLPDTLDAEARELAMAGARSN